MDENRMDRFVWTGEDGNMPRLITNDMLQCRDCRFCMEQFTSECEIYEVKPGYVMDNERPCRYYEKRTAAEEPAAPEGSTAAEEPAASEESAAAEAT